MIAVPTTAGTGSEVTLWAVITDPKRKIKFNVGGTPDIASWVALIDPELTPNQLLFRLFHETGVRVFDPIPLEERCTCSAERIEAMLRDNFSAEERAEMAVDGQIEVVCEFCSADYHFHPHDFEDTQH